MKFTKGVMACLIAFYCLSMSAFAFAELITISSDSPAGPFPWKLDSRTKHVTIINMGSGSSSINVVLIVDSTDLPISPTAVLRFSFPPGGGYQKATVHLDPGLSMSFPIPKMGVVEIGSYNGSAGTVKGRILTTGIP